MIYKICLRKESAAVQATPDGVRGELSIPNNSNLSNDYLPTTLVKQVTVNRLLTAAKASHHPPKEGRKKLTAMPKQAQLGQFWAAT